MNPTYVSRGKGYGRIVRDARRLLDLAMRFDASTGEDVLDSGAILDILAQVDDAEHFQDPMAQALTDLILEREGTGLAPPF
jgi:hypothetical protein